MFYLNNYYKIIHNNIGDNMKKANFLNKSILLFIFIFFVCSILTLYSASTYIDKSLIIKQLIWYIIGIIIMYIIKKLTNKYIFKNHKLIFSINIILLSLLLIFAPTINGSKCWFVIPTIGNFQPSEFMKISLILTLSNIINDFDKRKTTNLKSEITVITKVLIITLIPSILTFLQPDTGAVIIYFIIMITMLFVSKLRIRWFILFSVIIISILGVIFYLYYFNQNLFINIFSTNLFYRLERILSWSNNSSYQLENALISIGNSSVFPTGIKNIPLYYPYPVTDFIFASFTSSFGYICSMFLIINILLFDCSIIKTAINSKGINRYITIGSLSVLIYQQIQDIGLNIGLLPITGITLPFISYGGSSLLSYMIIIGIILNINKENEKQL